MSGGGGKNTYLSGRKEDKTEENPKKSQVRERERDVV
jgi:hypothetical protein